ncbi:STAM-binding protein isoform X1 [Colletes gigas]|uniref:STAM-binding protein isoform X1 n=1 Tax=Colletes gigas TaxID=935657 RepID=UPI001C9A314D|nr:STAM-binding protein isoform X1 [Colletes gigas]
MNKEKSETKTIKHLSSKDIGMSDPRARLKALSDQGSNVEMDRNIPPQRYYRSGVEMIRMADMYMKDNDLEHAYILYVKFITIFVEKIRDHPQFHMVPSKDKEQNQQTLRKIIPKAEELKKQLLEQYQADFEKYLEDAKEREKIEKEKLKQEELEKLREEEERKNKQAALAAVRAAKAAMSTVVTSPEESKLKKVPSIAQKPLISLSTDIAAQTSKEKRTPTIDRSTKPSVLMSDNLTLRDIVLPTKLMHNFLMVAFGNTMNNKETCGILAGKIERHKLVVTHLLIPEQTGSPDSCVTHNEEDIFDYQDQHNLITLGWIHTHPTQTAFLSSVDLHTHCAYQLMMAEAIAIVCAPKYDETGFFILTPEYGLDFIANCRESGFHPHPTKPPLYMEAKHCKMDVTAAIEVVDLRRK